MAKLLGKTIAMILNIAMIPIVLILAIPLGILKARRAQKSRLLFTGEEQALLGKAQRTIHMEKNGLLSPDRDLLEVAKCIENARCDYQAIKSRERFDSTFSDFVFPRINNCHVTDWDNVVGFFGFSSHTKHEVAETFVAEEPFDDHFEVMQLEKSESSANVQNVKIMDGLTSPFEPRAELQTEEGFRNYFKRLSSFDRATLHVEFANVRAAKHNLTFMPTGLNEFKKVQALVTDLTDKSVAICVFVFGQPAVFGFGGGDLRPFNDLVNTIDDSVANLNLEPEQHGRQLLEGIGEHLLIRP